MAQKFVTKKVEEAILKTPYASTDGVAIDDKKVIARYFNPMGAGTWYVIENDDWEHGRTVFGAVTLGYGLELGPFSLDELEAIKLPFGMHIERDSSVDPFKHTLGHLRKLHHEELM